MAKVKPATPKSSTAMEALGIDAAPPAAATVAAPTPAPWAAPSGAAPEAAASAIPTAEVPGAADQPAPPPEASPAKKAKAPAMRDALFVRSVPPSFRRCGFSFDREGSGIALDALTEEQIEALETEPNLRVERVQFPLDEDA